MSGNQIPPASEAQVLGQKPRVRKETHSLKYDFTEVEIINLNEQLYKAIDDKDRTEADKKASASEFKSRIDYIDAEMKMISTKAKNKSEFRDIDCELTYHSPKQGMKQLIRMDTLEVVDTKLMTEHECQEVLPLEE